jgi:hypothetical protein
MRVHPPRPFSPATLPLSPDSRRRPCTAKTAPHARASRRLSLSLHRRHPAPPASLFAPPRHPTVLPAPSRIRCAPDGRRLPLQRPTAVERRHVLSLREEEQAAAERAPGGHQGDIIVAWPRIARRHYPRRRQSRHREEPPWSAVADVHAERERKQLLQLHPEPIEHDHPRAQSPARAARRDWPGAPPYPRRRHVD